jgi:hypothetical protein
MEFNILKCKIMHLSPHNLRHKFSMGRTELSEIQEMKVIGVTILSNPRPSASVREHRVPKTAQAVLDQISHAFHYQNRQIFLRLSYKQYVRSSVADLHLHGSALFWSPGSTFQMQIPNADADPKCSNILLLFKKLVCFKDILYYYLALHGHESASAVRFFMYRRRVLCTFQRGVDSLFVL